MPQDREPERLFQPLLGVLGRQGPTGIHHALFVPPDSLYSKPSTSSGGGEEQDLRWQHRLRDTWEASLPALPAAAKLQVLAIMELCCPPKKPAALLFPERAQDALRVVFIPTPIIWLLLWWCLLNASVVCDTGHTAAAAAAARIAAGGAGHQERGGAP